MFGNGFFWHLFDFDGAGKLNAFEKPVSSSKINIDF